MLTSKQINDAGAYVEWLRQLLNERVMPANARNRASGSCLAIAQDHHHAIVLLIRERLYASSFALLRVTFEAFVRGEWLVLCAQDTQIEEFLKGNEPPRIDVLLSELEKNDAFEEMTLSLLKKHTWKTMCAYTHTGGLHVQRWNSAEAIEPNYSSDEVIEVLHFAEIIASLSVLGTVALMNDEQLALQVLEGFKKRVEAQ